MSASAAVTQTIILAAGSGTRLAGARNSVPKPLLEVGGVPLVAHVLRHAHLSGCLEAVIVVGHDAARVQASIEAMTPSMALRFVENPDASTPNGDSLLVAERVAAGRFFLQMVDHLFAEPVLSKLAGAEVPEGGGRVLVDRAPHGLDLSDATKVRLAGGEVVAIGKAVEPWDAIDAGCFLLTPAVFEALRAVPASERRTVSAAMRQFIRNRALSAVDLSGVRWIDVDTPADHRAAEAWLAAGASLPAAELDVSAR